MAAVVAAPAQEPADDGATLHRLAAPSVPAAETQPPQRRPVRGVALLAAGILLGAILPFSFQKFLDTSALALAGAVPAPVDAPTAPEPPPAAAARRSSPPPSPSVPSPPVAPEPSEIPEPPARDPLAEAEAAVRAWAAAWSEQRVDGYLSAYADAFVPPDNLGRTEWEAQRRERILRPKSIELSLGPLQAEPQGPDRIRVSFEQAYETPTYRDRVRKTLELVAEAGTWKIASERAEELPAG